MKERVDTDLNREFFIANTRIAENHLKKCSRSLAIIEMQIKNMRFHLKPLRMAEVNNTSYNSFW